MTVAVDYAVFGIRIVDSAFDMLVFLESFETEGEAKAEVRRRLGLIHPLRFSPLPLSYCILERYYRQKE